MSFSRLPYDTCTYKQVLAESIGPGEYQVSTPNHCSPCFVPSPWIQVGGSGASICPKDLVDVDSELLGIMRKQSKCPGKNYLPSDEPFCKTQHLKECNSLDSETTRLSNPPCTLRSRGWNRWEWLCKNPQENVLVPFDNLVNNRLVVKDAHRPNIPKPLDQTLALPKPNDQPEKELFCGSEPEMPHPLNYRVAKELAQY
jgi:hypothetical protein